MNEGGRLTFRHALAQFDQRFVHAVLVTIDVVMRPLHSQIPGRCRRRIRDKRPVQYLDKMKEVQQALITLANEFGIGGATPAEFSQNRNRALTSGRC